MERERSILGLCNVLVISCTFFSLIISTALAFIGYLEWGSILIAVANCAIVAFVCVYVWVLILKLVAIILLFLFKDAIKSFAAASAASAASTASTYLMSALLLFLILWLPIRTSKEKSFIWQWDHLYYDANSCEPQELARPTEEPNSSNGNNTFPVP